MKRGGLIVVAVVVVLVLIFAGQLAGSYNRLVASQQGVQQGWAEVDNQLQRRNSLIGNLAETVKGTALQEQQVFGDIAAARAAMAGAKTPQEQVQAAQGMDSALGRLLVVIENYPQLRSNEAFLGLMDELAGTENRIAVARDRYNQVVKDYNTMVKRFPTNLYAGIMGFKDAPYYPVPEAAKATPKVDFSGLKQSK